MNQKHTKEEDNAAQSLTMQEYSRRQFVQQLMITGAGAAMLSAIPHTSLFGSPSTENSSVIKARGYAAFDTSGVLSPWEFNRRAVGDDDVLLDIKFCGVCHSDIHTVRSDWREQAYPLVAGHEMAGIVKAVGKNVTRFKIGDRAGVGCFVKSCGHCIECNSGHENYCKDVLWTYGRPDATDPTGTTQGGYSTIIVTKEHFVFSIPEGLELKHAGPLLCAGITTFSPIMRSHIKQGMKVGVAGIGGLGHLAVKLAVALGADVYAFTSSADKISDLKSWGVKEAIVTDDFGKLEPYKATLDYLFFTSAGSGDITPYVEMVKPYGYFTQLGIPKNNMSYKQIDFSRTRVNINASLVGGVPETQEMLEYFAKNKIRPEVEIISAKDLNQAYDRMMKREVRYRFVVDLNTV